MHRHFIKHTYLLLTAVLFWGLNNALSQNIGIGTKNPDASAILELYSKQAGFLPPRLSNAERNTIVHPATGLVVYCTDCDTSGQLQFFDGTQWQSFVYTTAYGPIAPICGVNIGFQKWSCKNLDTDKYNNGDPIPQVTDPTEWSNLTTGAWCWYDNDSATYGAVYGRLYNWYAVNDPRGIAPVGWHVSTSSDWNVMVRSNDFFTDTLVYDLAMNTTFGKALKDTGSLYWGLYTGTNSTRFTALPGGIRNAAGLFGNIGTKATWWCTDDKNPAFTFYIGLSASNYITKFFDNKKQGCSVRLVRN